jgi:hypothetical protein
VKRKSDKISSPIPQYTSYQYTPISIPPCLSHTHIHIYNVKINEHPPTQETAPPHPWRYSAIPRKVDGSSVIRDWSRHLKLSQENDGSNVWQQARHILFTEVTYNYAAVMIFFFFFSRTHSLSLFPTLPFSQCT